MIRIELTGSNTATCPEMGLTVTRSKHGVIDALARQMIAAGANENEMIEVYRGATRCFSARPIGDWTKHRLTENDDRGFLVRTFISFERSALQS